MNPHSIRTFDRADVEFALAQTDREGWDSTRESFEACLVHDPEGCFIAEADGRRVGMVTTVRYGRTGWIGHLIVPPEYRRQGIGESLMTRAMTHLWDQGIRTMRLEADPMGVRLYRRLGFVDEFESLRFRLRAYRGMMQATAARVRQADLPTVATFDAEHFGDKRDRLLPLLFQHARAAYWLPEGGETRGYALAVPSEVGIRIGPWLAVDGQAAQTLLQSILADLTLTDSPPVKGLLDESIVLGVPGKNARATALLESYGFGRCPSSLRMIRGPQTAAGHPENVFAIANGAMG